MTQDTQTLSPMHARGMVEIPVENLSNLFRFDGTSRDFNRISAMFDTGRQTWTVVCADETSEFGVASGDFTEVRATFAYAGWTSGGFTLLAPDENGALTTRKFRL